MRATLWVPPPNRTYRMFCGVALAAAAGCTGGHAPATSATQSTACAGPRCEGAPSSSREGAVEVPDDPPKALYARRVLARGLDNPREILPLEDGSILVAEAGRGDPEDRHTGQFIRLIDRDDDRDFDQPTEREVVVDDQHSVNILERLAVHRDEVFGPADIERGGGEILATVVDPTEGSNVLRLRPKPVEQWGTTPDNANSIAYHPERDRWFAVQSFANTVIELRPGGETRTLTEIPDLEQGQQAVPASLVHEPATGGLLVVLFTGQVGGDTAGSGVDFVPRSGRVVRVDPANGQMEPVVTGLNAPIDVALGTDRTLYALEFCQRFLEPVDSRQEALETGRHGGFERFSGRLLRIGLESGKTTVVANELDLPTNVRRRDDGKLLVTAGQGTPERPIPAEKGSAKIEGRLIALTPR